MASRIRAVDGDVLVVCGGFHVAGLRGVAEEAPALEARGAGATATSSR